MAVCLSPHTGGGGLAESGRRVGRTGNESKLRGMGGDRQTLSQSSMRGPIRCKTSQLRGPLGLITQRVMHYANQVFHACTVPQNTNPEFSADERRRVTAKGGQRRRDIHPGIRWANIGRK